MKSILVLFLSLIVLQGCNKSETNETYEGEILPPPTLSSNSNTVIHILPSTTLEVSDSNFNSEIETYQGIAVVDFHALWCGPCRRMGPLVSELAEDLKEIKVRKLDVDDSPSTANKYDVHAIPCIILFKDGKELVRHFGVHSKEEMKTWIEEAKK